MEGIMGVDNAMEMNKPRGIIGSRKQKDECKLKSCSKDADCTDVRCGTKCVAMTFASGINIHMCVDPRNSI